MQIEIFLIIAGVIGLWIGSGITVDFGKKIAESLKISTLIIGLTIASIGTSLGEIVTNIVAGYHRSQGLDTSGLALGTVIGSNISLITFVLGFCGLFAVYTMGERETSLKRDWSALFIAIAFLFLFSIDDMKIDKVEGFSLMFAYGIYLFIVLKHEQVIQKVFDGNMRHKWLFIFGNTFVIFIGIMIAVYSAEIIVDNVIGIANILKTSEEMIGILIGFGTSLPELSISLRSIIKGSHGLSLGNLIGGGITDPLLSLGIGAFMAPILVDKVALFFDIPFLFIATLLAWLFFMRGRKLDKFEATLLIIVYAVFIYLKFFVL